MARPAASGADSDLAAFVDQMCLYCELLSLASGEQLRVKGQHYRNMYLITHGECAVALDPGNNPAGPIARGPGQPIGEIGFLRGMPATATVTACERMQVMVIDDETIAIIEAREPGLIAALLQRLSGIADDRTSYNLTQSDGVAPQDVPDGTEILLCRNAAMLRQAQRQRYEVYCNELGRKPHAADPKKRIIADALDASAHCFIAVHNGKAVGTIRVHLAGEGTLGSLQQLYGMQLSQHHPHATCVSSMFVVARDLRRTPVAAQLLSYAMQFALNHGVAESYIDCVPELVHYYRAIGFRRAEEPFFHPVNGPSIPMRIDLETHGKGLAGQQGWGRRFAVYAKSRAYKFSDALRS